MEGCNFTVVPPPWPGALKGVPVKGKQVLYKRLYFSKASHIVLWECGRFAPIRQAPIVGCLLAAHDPSLEPVFLKRNCSLEKIKQQDTTMGASQSLPFRCVPWTSPGLQIDKTTRYNSNYTEGLILESRVKSRAKAKQKYDKDGGGGLRPPPMVIMVQLALALHFTLGSEIYPSV